MRVLDSHTHSGLDRWEPIETLRYHLRQAGVARAILVQHLGPADHSYPLECMRRFPGEFGLTMLVPQDADDYVIRDLANQGARGIRLSADARAPGDDPLRQWRVAAQLDLAVSTSSMPPILDPQFQEVLETFPRLNVVLEHLGGARSRPPTTVEEFAQVMKLARFPNLHIKVHGLGEFCQFPFPFRDIPPFVDMVLEAFGPERMLWGSDFPLVCIREGYARALEFAQEYLAKRMNETTMGAIFYGNAARLWRL